MSWARSTVQGVCPCCGEAVVLSVHVGRVRRARKARRENRCDTCQEPLDAAVDKRPNGRWRWRCWRCRVKRQAQIAAAKAETAALEGSLRT
jgi:hypothetical protein